MFITNKLPCALVHGSLCPSRPLDASVVRSLATPHPHGPFDYDKEKICGTLHLSLASLGEAE